MKRHKGIFAIGWAVLAVLVGVLLFRHWAQPSPRVAATHETAAPVPSPGPTVSALADPTEPPADMSSSLTAAPPRADQPLKLRPEPPAASPDWQLLDWSLKPLPQKPGVQLRAASYLAPGKYPFVRVEQEIQIGSDGRALVLRTVEMVGDQIIVKLPDGSPAGEIYNLAAKLGGRSAAKPFAPDSWLVSLPRNLEAVPEAIATSVRTGITVDYAEPNFLVRPLRTPNDPRMNDFSQWHLYNNSQVDKDIKAPRAWDRRASAAYGTTNKVIVAVIDSGVRYTHEDLAANMWTNPSEIAGDGLDNDNNGLVDDVYGADYLGGDGDPMDPNNSSHGTHCAGLIGAVGNNGVGVTGVAWSGVQIMALRFINGTGSITDNVKCIDYAIAKGAKVINASYGSVASSSTEAAAIWRAQQAAIAFVAAAGNDGTNNDSVPFYPASYTDYFAPPRRTISNIIAVGATDRNDSKASFSNYGATSVDLFAPGVEMWSTTSSGTSNTSYSQGQGTSFAAPVVSGSVALLVAEYPNDSLAQRISRVINANAVDAIPALSGQCVTGGRLNLAKLLPAADVNTLPQALVWHRPAYTEPLISSTMRTPSVVSLSNDVMVYSGTKKFNNTSGVNTSGLVNQIGGWLFYRTSPAALWSSNSLGWHTNISDYQFWKATIPNVPAGTTEYYLQLDFDSGARTTYAFSANNADGFSTGTNQAAAQSSPYVLNVAKASASVAISDTNQTYDGTARAVTVTTSPPGLSASVTYNGSASAPTNAGSYEVLATVDDTNYAGSASGILVVNKAAATVQIGNISQAYDGSPKAVTVTTDPPELNVSVTYDGAFLPPTAAGTYAVAVSVTDTNYAGSSSVVFSIVSPPVTFESVFGNADPVGDLDGDGVPALLEYALGGGTNSDDFNILPCLVPESRMALVATVRTNNADRLSVQAQVSAGLADAWLPVLVPGVRSEDQSGVPENFERRVYFFDAGTNMQTFMRLRFSLESAAP